MEAYRLGEFPAFEELYRRHASKVYGFLLRRVGTADAQDLLQEVFAKLHTHRGKYDAALPFLPWLFTITSHAVVDQARKRQREGALSVGPGIYQEPVAPPRPAPVLHALTDEAQAALTDAEREIVVLRFDHDLSFAEIAERLHLETPNVRQIASRALKKVRRIWTRSPS